MTQCDKCHRSAVIYQRYSGMHLCGEHFDQDVHRKIRESLRKTGLFSRGSRIAVCLDGGRQSATLACVLKGIFSRRPDMEISAIIMKSGEGGRESAAAARAVAERLDMDCHAVRQQQDGSIDLRREMLFESAALNGANILATGECLDDEALRIFVSYLKGDANLPVERECGFRQGPAWIKPLQRVPRREARLYALRHGLGCDIEACAAGEGSLFQEAALLLAGFEGRHPGTYYSLVRGLEKRLRAKPLSVDAK